MFCRNENKSGDVPSSLSDSGVDSDTELAHSPDIVPDMDFGKPFFRPLALYLPVEGVERKKGNEGKGLWFCIWKVWSRLGWELREWFGRRESFGGIRIWSRGYGG